MYQIPKEIDYSLKNDFEMRTKDSNIDWNDDKVMMKDCGTLISISK